MFGENRMPESVNLPPHNIEAEKGIISWVLLDNETMRIYDSDKINYKDFYQKEHQAIYAAIKKVLALSKKWHYTPKMTKQN